MSQQRQGEREKREGEWKNFGWKLCLIHKAYKEGGASDLRRTAAKRLHRGPFLARKRLKGSPTAHAGRPSGYYIWSAQVYERSSGWCEPTSVDHTVNAAVRHAIACSESLQRSPACVCQNAAHTFRASRATIPTPVQLLGYIGTPTSKANAVCLSEENSVRRLVKTGEIEFCTGLKIV